MATLAELTDKYLAAVTKLRAAVAGMTPEQLAAKPIPGKWSTGDVVAHLADFEPVYADRIQRVIALQKPLLLGADENEFVKNLGYSNRDIKLELALIEAIRTKIAGVLRQLPESALQRSGVHSERGIVTLEQLLTTAAGHFDHHLAFVAEKKKALGLSS